MKIRFVFNLLFFLIYFNTALFSQDSQNRSELTMKWDSSVFTAGNTKLDIYIKRKDEIAIADICNIQLMLNDSTSNKKTARYLFFNAAKSLLTSYNSINHNRWLLIEVYKRSVRNYLDLYLVKLDSAANLYYYNLKADSMEPARLCLKNTLPLVVYFSKQLSQNSCRGELPVAQMVISLYDNGNFKTDIGASICLTNYYAWNNELNKYFKVK